jgi:hypothetical protein
MNHIFVENDFLEKFYDDDPEAVHLITGILWSKDFQNAVYDLRQSFGIPENEAFWVKNNSYDETKFLKWEKGVDSQKVKEAFFKLCQKCKIEKSMWSYLEDFVTKGTINFPSSRREEDMLIPGVKFPRKAGYEITMPVDDNGRVRVFIEVFKSLKKKDLEMAYNEISKSLNFKNIGKIPNLFEYRFLFEEKERTSNKGEFTKRVFDLFSRKYRSSAYCPDGRALDRDEKKNLKRETKKQSIQLNW